MTRREMELVRSSFEKLRPIPRGVGRAFYENLFELDPSLPALFSGDLENQGAMFVGALGLAVMGMDDAGSVDASVRDLGRRHALYGVKDAHFATFAEALIRTLSLQLGPEFTPEVAAAWREAFHRLGAGMKEAAAKIRG
jgi:hemoglobin-like flavoprotein